ncbi:DUF58 domain-containing protein [Verrucomicrobiales bacterium]|jgi:uncharacterized protein (DUF58 family)|nr:DUF58 domain-containing protein [Verrucomicrobiales bacterium]
MRPVPYIRLLWIALLVVVPAFTAVVYFEGLGKLMGLGAILLVLVGAIWDYAASQKLLAGVDCEIPDLIRGTKGRELDISVTFYNRGESLDSLRYGLAVSGEFKIEGEVVGAITAFESGKKRTVSYPITPLRRGQFFLDSLHIETASNWKWWMLRKGFDLKAELRIYPDLALERKRMASLFLMRGNEGSHVIRQVGKGRDFEQLREYQSGDDYIDIDWKATARRQSPVTRTYQIERTQEVYVVVDHSRLSAREIHVPIEEATEGDWMYQRESAGGDTMVTTQLEKFLHCSLVMASVAERQGDLFGFISFADKVDRFIRGRNGKSHYNIIRDALYTLEPRKVAPDYEQLMISLRQRLTRRALIVMLVDLSDPLTAEQFYEALPLVSKQHLVIVNMVRPEKANPIFSPNHEPENVSEIYENLAGHFEWQELREAGNKLRHLGVELGISEHEELCTETVTKYLNVKKRQLI